MKNKTIQILTILLTIITIWGCKNSNSGSFTGELNFDKDASYALGMNMGAGFKESFEMEGIIPDIDEFMKGIKDSLTGKDTRFDEFQAMEIINTAFDALIEKRDEEATQKENTFLAENSKKSGVRVTPSGLQYEVINESSGKKPGVSDIVLVHYEGKFIDGMVFDSSYERGSPAEIPIDAVIPGWAEGLQLMGIGSKYMLYIPSELGYGERGIGPIPPYATLIFTVELLDILEYAW
jgi:FKBP-type peptidyl-prolyl cis-trans isomerase